MQINQFPEVMSSCRFCFMCRHLSAVGQVSGRESDTPRGRALIADRVRMHPEEIGNADFIEAIYRSDLSGANRFHCDGYHDGKGYDEVGLQLALRRDIVDAGYAPEKVKQVAAELKATENWSVEGKGDVLYFVDPGTAARPSVEKAVKAVLDKANVPYAVVRGGCIGKALNVLGFRKEAKEAMQKFAQVIKGSKAKIVVVSNPAAYDALVNDYKEAGIKLGVKVMHTSEYIKSLKLKFPKKAGKVYYLESDYLKNYNNNLPAPRELLAALKAEIVPFGTNNEESYTCGEGAVVLPKIDESLVEKLAKYIEARADNPKKDVIVVASPYTKLCLGKYTALNVKTLEELAAGCL